MSNAALAPESAVGIDFLELSSSPSLVLCPGSPSRALSRLALCQGEGPARAQRCVQGGGPHYRGAGAQGSAAAATQTYAGLRLRRRRHAPGQVHRMRHASSKPAASSASSTTPSCARRRSITCTAARFHATPWPPRGTLARPGRHSNHRPHLTHDDARGWRRSWVCAGAAPPPRTRGRRA